MASLFGLLLLFRLDTVVLMKGFEVFDYGKFEFIMFHNHFIFCASNNNFMQVITVSWASSTWTMCITTLLSMRSSVSY